MGWADAEAGDVGGRLAAAPPALAAGVGEVDGLFSLMDVVMMGAGVKDGVSGCSRVSVGGLAEVD